MNVKLERTAIALGVIGLVVMLPFDQWYTRFVGMGCLVAFVVCGVFLIASPWFLEQTDPEADPPAKADPDPG